MGLLNNVKNALGFKTIETPTAEERDLAEIKLANNSNPTPYIVNEFMGNTYDSFHNSGFMLGLNDKYAWMWITKIRNFHYSKFDWKNLPDGITKKRIEDILLGYGSVCIYKAADIYIAAPFYTTDFNIAGQPIKIKAFSQFDKGKEKELKVNTDDADACIIYNDNSGWVMGDSTQFKTFGTYYKIWSILNEIVLSHRRIENNGAVTNPKLINNSNDNDDKSNKKIEQAFRSTQLIMNADLDSFGTMKALQGRADNSPVVIITNQQADFWANHERLKSELKDNLGVNHSPFTEKKEKQSGMELGQNDSWVASDLTTECEMRSLGVESFNKLFKEKVSVCVNGMHEEEKEPKNGSEGAQDDNKDGDE